MTNPDVCPRCGTAGCPKATTDWNSEVLGAPFEWARVYAESDIACTLRLLARIHEAGLACTCGLDPNSGVKHSESCPRGRFER